MIEPVESPNDPRIADYAHVGDSVWLRESGLFVAEGRLVVRRLLASTRVHVRSLLLTPAAERALTDILAASRCPIYVCGQRTMDAVAGFNFHRGCLGIAERPAHAASFDELAASSRLLALEGVGNPDNVGGLFRVAAAFGAGGILLGQGTGDPLYRKAIRTSMGAALQVPFARFEPWPTGLQSLRARGFSLVALTPEAGALAIEAFAASVESHARLVLMVGAEGAGLTHSALRLADDRVRIPIAAEVDSLNVVVAAAVALAFLRQR